MKALETASGRGEAVDIPHRGIRSEPTVGSSVSHDGGSIEVGEQLFEVEVGVLEVRESDLCNTRWARASIHVPADINEVRIVQDDGYEQAYDTSPYLSSSLEPESTGTFYTPQIHITGRAQAQVQGSDFTEHSSYTQWVG